MDYGDLDYRERPSDEEMVFGGRRIKFRELARFMIQEALDSGFMSNPVPDLKRSVTVAEAEGIAVFRVGATHYLWDQKISHLLELSIWPFPPPTTSRERLAPGSDLAQILGTWQPESSPSLSDGVAERMGGWTFHEDGTGLLHRNSGDRSITWKLMNEEGRRTLLIQTHLGPMVYQVPESSAERIVLRGPDPSVSDVVYRKTDRGSSQA